MTIADLGRLAQGGAVCIAYVGFFAAQKGGAELHGARPEDKGRRDGAAIRDAMFPLFMKMLYRKGNPQAWILDHRV